MPGTPPDESSPEDAPSRSARLAARRSRHARFVIAAVIVVVVIAGGIGAYALYSKDPSANAVPGDVKIQSPGASQTTAPAAIASRPAPRALSHAAPLKLWVGGDSLAGSFGPALGDQLGALGIVQTIIDFKVSSGLWSNDIRDWNARATEEMQTRNPEAVVFIIGTNDTPIVNNVDANHDGVPDWEPAYRVKVARMMDLLVGPNHRTVFWLGPPTLPDSGMNRGALAMGQVMREEAAKRSADVVYLDTFKLFQGADGGWSRQVVDDQGKTITARIPDGVHFTEDGAQYLARQVFKLIDARWHLSAQADLKDPIGWNFTSQSVDSVPGFSSRPTSRYNPGSSNSTGTTIAPVSESTTVLGVTPTTTAVVATTVPIATTVPTVVPTTVKSDPPTTTGATPTT